MALKPASENPGVWLDLPAAAQRASVSVRTVRRWIRTGQLPAYRVGPKVLRVYAAEVDRMFSRYEPTGDDR